MTEVNEALGTKSDGNMDQISDELFRTLDTGMDGLWQHIVLHKDEASAALGEDIDPVTTLICMWTFIGLRLALKLNNGFRPDQMQYGVENAIASFLQTVGEAPIITETVQ